jgi:uronate dehydrogenase
MQPASAIRFNRLLLTGAAGYLGREMRPRLAAYCNTLRLSDRLDMGLSGTLGTLGTSGPAGAAGPTGPARAAEELRVVELGEQAAVHALLEGVDAVVHLGGISTEQPWPLILEANIVGMVNLYEAARAHQTRRIVYASSNHATGFYRQDQVISPQAPMKPDGFYGLSKCFGENLAQLYWNRHGIETVSLRIGSARAEPLDRRMLATWMSLDDTERLIVAALTCPVVGHSVIYGMSDNPSTWWDNTSAAHIGYRPQDSSEAFRLQVEARLQTVDANDPAVRYQGGVFVRTGPL